MKVSKLLGERLKETPAGVTIKSHAYLIRAGYIKQVSNGIYTLLPPAQKINQKIQAIIREEMDEIDGQEVLFPVVMPKEMWEKSGRYTIPSSAGISSGLIMVATTSPTKSSFASE